LLEFELWSCARAVPGDGSYTARDAICGGTDASYEGYDVDVGPQAPGLAVSVLPAAEAIPIKTGCDAMPL
jgi:hypothetical protein